MKLKYIHCVLGYPAARTLSVLDLIQLSLAVFPVCCENTTLPCFYIMATNGTFIYYDDGCRLSFSNTKEAFGTTDVSVASKAPEEMLDWLKFTLWRWSLLNRSISWLVWFQHRRSLVVARRRAVAIRGRPNPFAPYSHNVIGRLCRSCCDRWNVKSFAGWLVFITPSILYPNWLSLQLFRALD